MRSCHRSPRPEYPQGPAARSGQCPLSIWTGRQSGPPPNPGPRETGTRMPLQVPAGWPLSHMPPPRLTATLTGPRETRRRGASAREGCPRLQPLPPLWAAATVTASRRSQQPQGPPSARHRTGRCRSQRPARDAAAAAVAAALQQRAASYPVRSPTTLNASAPMATQRPLHPRPTCYP